MISWKNTFDNDQLQQLASYVVTLNGTTPANPKAAEGELWQEESSSRSAEIAPDSGMLK
jgi:cytochrome c oxidase cbb3-type subunit 3